MKQRHFFAFCCATAFFCARASGATAPTVETGPATDVTMTSAVLNATVTRNGSETGVGFEYGTDTSYGISVGSIDGNGQTEGTYTVQLPIGGLTAQTLYHYRAVAANSAGTTLGEDRTFIAGNNSPVAGNDDLTLPPGFGPFPLQVLANDTDGDNEPLRVISVTRPAHGTVAIINEGTAISYQLTNASYVGDDTFTYIVTDGPTMDSATVVVHLPIREPIVSVLFAKGDAVPGAETSGSGVPAGAIFERFGLPSINDAGEVAFRAEISSSEGLRTVILGPAPQRASAVLVSTGDNAPASDGRSTELTFSTFKHPLLNDLGEVAFVGTVSGRDVNSANTTGIWTNEGGTLRMVAREGDIAPGVSDSGAVYAHFLSVALGDAGYAIEDDAVAPAAVAFVAQLELGRGGVTSDNDLGLWVYKRGRPDGAPQLLLRKGDLLDLRANDGFPGRTILSFIALQPLPAAFGQGHGVAFNQHTRAADEILALVRFTDGTQAIVEFEVDANFSISSVAESGDAASGNRRFKSFGVPTQSPDGQNAFIAKFQLDSENGVGPENNSAIYVANDLDTPNAFHIVSEGDPLPENSQMAFRHFQNVVNNGRGGFAFLAAISGSGVDPANDAGVWWNLNGLTELAREGSAAPGPDNAIFLKFISLAMSGDGRAIVKARARNASTLQRRRGIWFTDKNNALQLCLREGDSVAGTDHGPIQSLDFLEYVSGSPTQARSFNNVGDLLLRTTFADGTQAIVKAVLP